MIVTLFDFILLWIAIKKYNKRQYIFPLVIFAFFMTDGFIVSFGGINPLIKHMDFGILQIIITSVIMRKKYKYSFNIRNDSSGKIIFFFTLYFLFEFIRTIFGELDTFSYALADIRLWFIPFSYFMFRRIDIKSFLKAGKIILGLTILSSMLYVIQYITHIELVNTYIGDFSSYRMQITPAFLEFFILYLMFCENPIKYKYLYIALFLTVLYISQNRTPIICLALLAGFNIVLSKNIKYAIITMIILIAIFPIFSTMFESRSKNQTSLLDKKALQMIKTMDYNNLHKENTFFFRIAILLERGQYLIEHPEKTLLGVGSIHEDSPHNTFNFATGTVRYNGIGRAQLYSIDTMWCAPLIKYGFLGVLLIFITMIFCLKTFFDNRNGYVQKISFLIFIAFFIQSLSSNSLLFSYNLFLMSIMLAYNFRYNKLKKGVSGNDT